MRRDFLGIKLGVTITLGLFFLLSMAPPVRAQNPQFMAECPNPSPLCLDNNFFVTGDYVVGGVGLRGLGVSTPNGMLARGTISIPDCTQAQAMSPGVNCATLPKPVPAGADIVAAFLYWETVESFPPPPTPPPHPGQNGFFKPLGQEDNGKTIPDPGYPITGTILGNQNAPASWSSGGCVGNNSGGKSIVAYRADVRPYLLEDANGNLQANGNFQVMLTDSGTNGATVPFTLGATLVVIYRVLSSAEPLEAIVIYDGAFSPSNQTAGNMEMSQTMKGFYEPALNPVAKITHIVGNGKFDKNEQALFQGSPLNYLYPTISSLAAFPGVYNGSWDTATWDVSALVKGGSFVNTSVVQSSSNKGCVDWGAVIFSTTVEDADHDGLLQSWKAAGSYPDEISVQNGLPNPVVYLPGASSGSKDIFVEIDYLVLRDPKTNAVLHSHLPKQIALDMVGDAFANQNIHVHFDVGPTNYAGNCSATHPLVCPDPYVIPNGTGGNEISESGLFCTDPAVPTPATLCQFPNTSSVGWKGGFQFVQTNAAIPNSNPPVPLGNFQFGRKDSYHYVLFGHALGVSRSFWTTFGATLQDPSFAKLISISNLPPLQPSGGSTFLVTIQTPQATPQLIIYPGYCSLFPATLGCSDSNVGRITVSGAIGQPALNGTYSLANAISTPDFPIPGVTTTTFTISTAGLPSALQTYNFDNESRLTVEYLGPVSTSGHSDFPGGADTAVSFGLWPADDPAGCKPDPSVGLAPGQTYCDDQVGTVQAQAGTLLHEVGHTLTLAHGGIFYPTPDNPNGTLVAPSGQQANNPPFSQPAFGLNCNPAILSSMNYLFQIRGFPDLLGFPLPDGNQAHPIDYSGQTLPSLTETALSETVGIGSDVFTGNAAPHFTRWYGPPTKLQTLAGQFATFHCDGTPAGPNEPLVVRLEGKTFSNPIDWDNDNDPVPDPNPGNPVPWQDVNFNGSTSASPDPAAAPAFNYMQGYNDWANTDLSQIGARENALGFSGSGGAIAISQKGGGGAVAISQKGGGGAIGYAQPGGGGAVAISQKGGGGATAILSSGGGGDQNVETACSTADPPTGLTATLGTKSVILNWNSPGGPCQVKTYNIWRSTNGGPFTQINQRLRGGNGSTAPPTMFTDNNVKNNNTYTYFVTETNVEGATSDSTKQVSIFVH